MDLRNKTALITGASRGLGLALARRLAQEGARVVLVARDPVPLDQAAATLREQGHQAYAVAADLGDKRAILPLAAKAAALAGPVDILVNNASTLGPTPLRLLLDTECEDLERVLTVNTIGPFRLTKAVAGSMALRGEGLVVNISSDAAMEAYPSWGAYGASKAALDHLTRTWASELADTGVRLLAVDPGEMDTAMHAAAMPDADPSSLASPVAVAKRIVAMMRDSERAPNGARITADRLEVGA